MQSVVSIGRYAYGTSKDIIYLKGKIKLYGIKYKNV